MPISFFRRISTPVFALACIGIQLAAATEPPVLVVPRGGVAMQIAAPAIKLADTSGEWELYELDGAGAVVPAQLSPAMAADGTPSTDRFRLLASIPPSSAGDAPRRFQLRRATVKTDAAFAMKIAEIDKNSIRIDEGRRPLLVYNHGEITSSRVPEDDPRRHRACYVHPVWGIDGEVLTDDFPADHYHHHGIFWTWPHVEIDGRRYDLWSGWDIRQKFVRWMHRRTGPAAAELTVENGWYADDLKVMIERVWIRAYRTAGGARAIDFEFAFTPTDRPITLRGAEEKSYGGLSMRFNVGSPRKTLITVPEGRTSDDLLDTRLPWADLSYPFGADSGPSGAAVFVPPNHPDYPPTWLTRHFGALCMGWPGVKGKTFPPGEAIRLNYRVWIHQNALDRDQLQRAYQGYVEAAKVRWE
ncbi:MAG: hypothetical protein GX594_03165 [Pirellulaceae bacterium]|nr:hypothetical protein [Pirellulaceae bacterium]